MRPFTLRPHLTPDQIRKQMQTTTNPYQFKRWQTIYFVAKGLSSHEIADMVGIGRNTVKQFVFRYNHQGIDGLTVKPRGGRKRSYLTLEKEQEILTMHSQQASEGNIVTASMIQKPFETIIGKTVHISYIYDVIKRHGWRKINPRPRHPSANTLQQEEFKKKPAALR